MPLSFTLNDMEKKFLCRQAALAIDSGLTRAVNAAPLEPFDVKPDSALLRDLGSFVTLTVNRNLRGCIGTIIGREPLWLNVWNMARAAAFKDPRFPPITQSEWSRARYEISVLDQPSPCPDVEQIEIGRDGLILQFQGQSAVFLPQVPVEQGWDVTQYLEHLCRKAGIPENSWKSPEARLFWYEAFVFHC